MDGLEDAEPAIHLLLCHLPARLARHALRRLLRTERTWPWAAVFTTSRPPGPRNPAHPAASRDGPSSHGRGQ
jgi:hypothetical protein